ncbi:hypothetical protein D3C86_1560730 [compost metagenome]
MGCTDIRKLDQLLCFVVELLLQTLALLQADQFDQQQYVLTLHVASASSCPLSWD